MQQSALVHSRYLLTADAGPLRNVPFQNPGSTPRTVERSI